MADVPVDVVVLADSEGLPVFDPPLTGAQGVFLTESDPVGKCGPAYKLSNRGRDLGSFSGVAAFVGLIIALRRRGEQCDRITFFAGPAVLG